MMVVQPSNHRMMDSSHPHTLLTRLSEQRSRGLFCDVTIVVEDIKFHAHRNILAATSGYFRNAFTASETCLSSQVLELPDLKSDVFASILNFIYSSKVESASTEDSKSLVAAGKRLGIPFLEKLLEIGKQESGEVLQSQASANSESFPNHSKPSAPCMLKKEMQRPEEQDCSKGPRITNAFSITEVTAGDPFTPMDLHSNRPDPPDMECHPPGCPAPSMPALESDTEKVSEPTHALTEHSYAVSKGHETSDPKEAVPLSDKGCTKPVLTPPKTLTNHRLGPIKKRHKLCKGMMASISNEISAPVQSPVSSSGVQNVTPDPSSLQPSSDSLTDLCSAPDLLPPPEVTPPEDADPPSLIPEDMPSAPTYHCQQCPETFSNSALLSIHMQVHKRRFVSHLFCKYCQKKFMHLKRLRNHEQVCVKGPPELEMNGKETSDGLDLNTAPSPEDAALPILDLQDPPTLTSPLETPQNAVAKAAGGQRSYKCSVCKRAYVTLSSLKRHENVHSWQRAYPCHYCNKVFALAEYRTKHEIWHTGERRYQCIFCLETFMTYYILKNHQKSFHGIDPRLAVNKKSANGGFKGSVYPIKLYRLLPMKFRKKRYKSYSQTYSEATDDTEQSFTAPLDSNSPAAPPESPVPPGSTGSAVSGQSLFSLPVTFMATPKMVASEMPRITFDQPSDQNVELSSPFDNSTPFTRGRGFHPTDKHRKTSQSGFEGTGSPVFSYGYTASVAAQENTGSSMITHRTDTSSTPNSRDVMPFLNIPPVCSFEGLSKLSELSAAAQTIEAMANQLLQPRPETMTQNLSPGGKTETYIAKPACPGPSINNQVLPLCQITVKIGNEAIIRRKIKGSKLFPKKKKRRSWKQVEDPGSSSVEEGIGCPSLRLRAEVMTSVTDNEAYDDVNDPENDKPWRPYYTYKPKRKGKKLRSRQKRMKAIQYYTKPMSPEAEDDLPEVDHGPEEHIPESKRQLRSRSPREAFHCNSCGSSFPTPSSLSMHIVSCQQRHCKTCGKLCPFEDPPSADAPYRESCGDFVCRSCTDDGSYFSSDVAGHSLSSEKRYRCSFCPQRFLYLATKKSHEAKHLEKSSKGRSYRFCPKVCKSAAVEESKLFSKTTLVREPENTEIKGSAGSYSPLAESKPEPWGSPEICSAPKMEELALSKDTGGLYLKAPHTQKKMSQPVPYKSDRPFPPLLTEMHRRKSKKSCLLERSKDFGLGGHRQNPAGTETQGQKGHLPDAATNHHVSTSRIYPACLTRVPVTKGASLQSPKSEWRLCKEEPFFNTHN